MKNTDIKKTNGIFVTLSGESGIDLLGKIDALADKRKWSRAQVARHLMWAGMPTLLGEEETGRAKKEEK